MKGRMHHEHAKHRATGGVNEAEMDDKDRPQRYNDAPKIEGAAEERKHGGKAEHHRRKRKHGGEVHHTSCKCHKCMGGAARAKGGEAKHHEVKVHGEHERHHAGRRERKDGGRTGSNEQPFSSAHKGEQPAAHKAEIMD